MNRQRLIDMLSVAFSVASISVAITMWVVTTFQTKADASKIEEALNKSIEEQELRLNSIFNDIFQIKNDVSYIRGKLDGN